MGWESKVAYAYEMLSCFCLSRSTPFSWMASPFALLLPFSTYKLFDFVGFLSFFFTFLALILSTIIYIWKHKSDENVLTSEVKKSSHDESENFATTSMLINESMIELEQGSDDSISDEESLIEIALPSGHFMDQQNKKELSYDQSLFDQQSLMEFLAEFNEMFEEENLIEIDISMGSIKQCSRFEIQT
uniref:Uncharacterized protein LOC101500977 n=1 Tax=Cicer arietinum TaxID=3827 RepID=A0A1S2YB17_CICAR|nr:uncharacterized protein LOC101500977 [Cicer arietinum]